MQKNDGRTTQPNAEPAGNVSRLVHRITDDVKTIASDEVELAKGELAHTARTAATEAAVVLLGGIVALIGLGLLCLVAVAALEPLISPLWLRLLIMAVVYLAIGGVVAGVFAKRLKKDAVPDLSAPVSEAKRSVGNIKEGLRG